VIQLDDVRDVGETAQELLHLGEMVLAQLDQRRGGEHALGRHHQTAVLKAAKRLMEEGVRRKKLRQDYNIYGQRQFVPTESPGQKLYDLMKQWPRWSTIIRHLD